jgi:transcriptional regulator of acetoin/glycerol metabolism
MQRLCAHDYPGNVRELEHLLVNATIFAESSCIEADELAIEPTQASPPSDGDPGNYASFKEAERERILASLNMHGWNRAKAARALGMARRTFYRRLKEHQIVLPQAKGGTDEPTRA